MFSCFPSREPANCSLPNLTRRAKTKRAASCPAARFAFQSRRDQVMWFATLLSTLLTLPPTEVMAAIAATEISEAISTYSMAVAPCSFFINLRKMDNMVISKRNLLIDAIENFYAVQLLHTAVNITAALAANCGAFGIN